MKSAEEIENIIENQIESITLDFKREKYDLKNKKYELIKDIMAMANALVDSKKYIILGIEEREDNEKEYVGIDDLEDPSIFENLLHEYIEPTVQFKYYSVRVKGKRIGVIEIGKNQDKPFMASKELRMHNGTQGFDKGDCFIRKGTRKAKMTRSDVNQMRKFLSRNEESLSQKDIKIGFGKKLLQERIIKFPIIDSSVLPSNIARIRYQKLLNLLHEFQKGKLSGEIPFDENSQVNYDNEKKKIEVGYSITRDSYTLIELEDRIEKIADLYREADLYFKFNHISFDLNLKILNSGKQRIEEPQIEIEVKNEFIFIYDNIPQMPRIDIFMVMGSSRPQDINQNVNSNNYPTVEKTKDTTIIKTQQAFFQHKQEKDIFNINPKFLVTKSKIEIPIKIRLFAKNISDVIETNLKLIVE
ncbi:ATP-binding protein [Streptococcus mutans]|nr:ATP-binding protein [Streptococcus mutans]MCB5121491.1 ATP-binding protein [Streptococcus mutans]